MKKTIFMLLMAGAVVLTASSCKKDDYASKDDLKALQDKVDKQGMKMQRFSIQFSSSKYKESIHLPDILKYNGNDVVLLFLEDDNIQDKWYLLPINIGYVSAVNSEIDIRYSIDNNRFLDVYLWQASKDQPFYLPNSKVLYFKAVAIPVSAIQANPGVDLNDYQAVQKAFSIE